AAFSVSKAADIPSNTNPDEAALNQWYNDTKATGAFNSYGADVAENFLNCTPKEKLAIKQAWRLTETYLNGVQKRRERAEFGRDSGELSNYISFIDVYLGRSAIKNAEMRVSFPYYIGPAVWRFFHTTPEILCTKPLEKQQALIPVFKEFFKLFATMYPCPYCRHHLNAYVIRNREVDMYPMEYILLGRDPNLPDFQVLLETKLSTVVDGATLRLFFWKLHNTVSSSIARSEPWYHKDEKAFYTTRYWPSLDSELARAKALNTLSISTERIYRLYGMLKPAAKLSGLRANLQVLLDQGDTESIRETCILADKYIKELEEAVLSGGFLEETYTFDPDLEDTKPYFTPEEEEFARSGLFVDSL
ncbi:MAG TPA: ERV1/ALR-related protein, partial [Allocoleopsis sp.]